MANMMINILVAMGMKLLTNDFVSRFIIHCLQAMAKKSAWELDDKLVADLAKALGVEPQ